MLNLITNLDQKIKLGNSLWMYDRKSNAKHTYQFDFVFFNNQNEIEYLDGKGELVRKNSLEFDQSGIFKEKGSFSLGVEFVDSQRINLIRESVSSKNENQEEKYWQLNLIRLNPTKIEISEEELSKIINKSDWEMTSRFGEKLTFTFVPWEGKSKSEVLKAIEDSKVEKPQKHLIRIKDSIVLIRQVRDVAMGKAIISKITTEEITVLQYNYNFEELILKRVN